ncbi:MAG TPA: sigma-70 family RNA polymerase sigma factor [Anaerolineae bacterium]
MFDHLLLARKLPIKEADTFATLYREHTAAVFNYCLFRVGDRTTAEDLTADTFERAWRARRRYRPERAAFNTWLFTIARRVVTDWQRRQARRRWVGLSDDQPDGGPSPEAQIEETEQQARLRRLVRSLDQSEQELIALKFGAGMTNRDIAPVLGKTETAVGSAVYRVMQKLRAQWQDTHE